MTQHAGQAAWIRTVLEEHEQPLLRYAVRLTGSIELARDVVQDTFLRLLREDRATVEGHLRQWLFTVCRHRCIDLGRKEARMHTVDPDTMNRQTPAGNSAEPGKHDEVLHAVGMLSDRQQEILRLRFQAGLSYQEISAVTGLSVSNVGFHLHTAVKELRGRMTPDKSPADREAT